ncbi:MAG: DUF4230 domain-containing protein [Clostridia bacterium]|nr:DUF4230 domain-containing protein [Clostridia bacterium]
MERPRKRRRETPGERYYAITHRNGEAPEECFGEYPRKGRPRADLDEITEAVARGVVRGNKRVRRMRRIRRLIFWTSVLLMAALALLAWRNKAFLASADAVLGTGAVQSKVDYKQLLLGDAVPRGMFVVLEQEARAESSVSQAVLGLDWFKVTRTLRAPAKGCFAVDLAALTETDIIVNPSVRTLTVTVPPAVLYTFECDLSAASFEDTERGLLAIGDLSLTMEQNAALAGTLDEACREAFRDPAVLDKADALAVEKLTALFGTVVHTADPGMTVIVKVGPRAETAAKSE